MDNFGGNAQMIEWLRSTDSWRLFLSRISDQLKGIVNSQEAHRRGMIQLSHKTVVRLEKCPILRKKSCRTEASGNLPKRRRLRIVESDSEEELDREKSLHVTKCDAECVVIESDEESGVICVPNTASQKPLLVDLVDSDSDQKSLENRKMRLKRQFSELFGSDSEDETCSSVLLEKYDQHKGKLIADQNTSDDALVNGVDHSKKSDAMLIDVRENENEMVHPGGNAEGQSSGEKDKVEPVLKIKVTAIFPQPAFEIEKSTEEPDSSTLSLVTSNLAESSNVTPVLEGVNSERKEAKSVDKQDVVSSSGLPASPVDNTCGKTGAGLIRVRDRRSLGISENWGIAVDVDKSASSLPPVSLSTSNPITSEVPPALTSNSKYRNNEHENFIEQIDKLLFLPIECKELLAEIAFRLNFLIRDFISCNKETQEFNDMLHLKRRQAALFIKSRMKYNKTRIREEILDTKIYVRKNFALIKKYFKNYDGIFHVLKSMLLSNSNFNENTEVVTGMITFILDKNFVTSEFAALSTQQACELPWHTVSDSSLGSSMSSVPGIVASNSCTSFSSLRSQESSDIASQEMRKEPPGESSIASQNVRSVSDKFDGGLNQNFRDTQQRRTNSCDGPQSNHSQPELPIIHSTFHLHQSNIEPTHAINQSSHVFNSQNPQESRSPKSTLPSQSQLENLTYPTNPLPYSTNLPPYRTNPPPYTANCNINPNNNLAQSSTEQLSETARAMCSLPTSQPRQAVANTSTQQSSSRVQNESSQISHASFRNEDIENVQVVVNSVIPSEKMPPTSSGQKSASALQRFSNVQHVGSLIHSSHLYGNQPTLQQRQKGISDYATQNASKQLPFNNSQHIQQYKVTMTGHSAVPKVPSYHQQNQPQQLLNQHSLLQSQSQHTPHHGYTLMERRYRGQPPPYQSLQVPREEAQLATHTQVPYRETQIQQMPHQAPQAAVTLPQAQQNQLNSISQPTKSHSLPQDKSQVTSNVSKSQHFYYGRLQQSQYQLLKYPQTQSQVSYQESQYARSYYQQTQSGQVSSQQTFSFQHPYQGKQSQVPYQQTLSQQNKSNFHPFQFPSTASQTHTSRSQYTHSQTAHSQFPHSRQTETLGKAQQLPFTSMPSQKSLNQPQSRLQDPQAQTQPSPPQSYQVNQTSAHPVVTPLTQPQFQSVQNEMTDSRQHNTHVRPQNGPHPAFVTQTLAADVNVGHAAVSQAHITKTNVQNYAFHSTKVSSAPVQLMLASQAHASQAHSSQAHSSQAHSSQAHSSQTHSSQAHSSQAHSSQAHSSQAHSSQALSAQFYPSHALVPQSYMAYAPPQLNTSRAPSALSNVKARVAQSLRNRCNLTQHSSVQIHPTQVSSTEVHLPRAPTAPTHAPTTQLSEVHASNTVSHPLASSYPALSPPSESGCTRVAAQSGMSPLIQRDETQEQLVQGQLSLQSSSTAASQRQNECLETGTENACSLQNGGKVQSETNMSRVYHPSSELMDLENCSSKNHSPVTNTSHSPSLMSMLSDCESATRYPSSMKSSELTTILSLLSKPTVASQSVSKSTVASQSVSKSTVASQSVAQSCNAEPINAQPEGLQEQPEVSTELVQSSPSLVHKHCSEILPSPVALSSETGSCPQQILPSPVALSSETGSHEPQQNPPVGSVPIPSTSGAPSNSLQKSSASSNTQMTSRSSEKLLSSHKTLPATEIQNLVPSLIAAKNSSSNTDNLGKTTLLKEVIMSNTRDDSSTSTDQQSKLFNEKRIKDEKYWMSKNEYNNLISEEISKVKSVMERTNSIDTRKDEEMIVSLGCEANLNSNDESGEQEEKTEEDKVGWQQQGKLTENPDLGHLTTTVLQELGKSADDNIVCSVKRELDNNNEHAPSECSVECGDCYIMSENIAVKEECKDFGLLEMKDDVLQGNAMETDVNSIPESNEDKPSMTKASSLRGGRSRSVSLDSGYKSPSPHLQVVSGHQNKGKSQSCDTVPGVEEREYICANCPKKAMLYCSACNGTCYCSIECQSSHWYRNHSVECDGVPETNVSSDNLK